MKITSFWDVMLCDVVEIKCFRVQEHDNQETSRMQVAYRVLLVLVHPRRQYPSRFIF
jgi:hypothetical protein